MGVDTATIRGCSIAVNLSAVDIQRAIMLGINTAAVTAAFLCVVFVDLATGNCGHAALAKHINATAPAGFGVVMMNSTSGNKQLSGNRTARCC